MKYANLHIQFIHLINWKLLKIVESSDFSKSAKFIKIGESYEVILIIRLGVCLDPTYSTLVLIQVLAVRAEPW